VQYNEEIEKSLCSRLKMKQKKLCSLENFNPHPKTKFNINKIKEIKLSEFCHYCS